MLSVVIPVFNEEKLVERNIRRVVKFIQSYGEPVEIVVVDDGSTDSTLEKIGKLVNEFNCVRIEIHAKNMGIGAALRTGLKSAKGDIIVTMDSNLTYPPEDIDKLLSKMGSTGADMVIGTPYTKGGDTKDMPFFRFFLSRCINFMDQILFRLNFTTPTSFFRAWKKELAKNIKIKSDRFESVAESAIRAHRMGYKIVEAPVKYRMVSGRTSRLKILPTMKKHIKMDIMLLFGGDLN